MWCLTEASSLRRKNGCCTREERTAEEMSEKRQESLGSSVQVEAPAFLRRQGGFEDTDVDGRGSVRRCELAGVLLRWTLSFQWKSRQGHKQLRVRVGRWGWTFEEKGESGKESQEGRPRGDLHASWAARSGC